MLKEHFLGLYEKALPPGWSWDKRLYSAKKLGFDYMEISIDETDDRISRLYWDNNRKTKLSNLSNKMGMPIRSICLSAHRRFPFGSADKHIREKAYEIMENAILFAEAMGIRVIQLAGYDVYYESSTNDSKRAFADGMKWAAEKAEQHQVMLGMEIMDTLFLNSISKHLSFEKEIKSPWYKLYPDIGNLTAWGNDIEKELEKGSASIIAIHLKDTQAVTETFPGKFKNVPFGTGCVNFIQCFRKLEQLGYKGPYMMEMWSNPEQDDIQTIKDALAFIEGQYVSAVSTINS
jgi:hexulose-6-phosphate isomerase